MGVKCSKCGISDNTRKSSSYLTRHEDYSCRYHNCNNEMLICVDCNRNLHEYGGNCIHHYKYSFFCIKLWSIS